ncbi:MAG TPA: hypothetical protein VFU47_08410 [Armatimonadota bacterium]|nr:hypothetical protein [Armatimonadota bacterium]
MKRHLLPALAGAAAMALLLAGCQPAVEKTTNAPPPPNGGSATPQTAPPPRSD